MDIQSIIDIIINNFNFGLIISINLLVYGLITIYNALFKKEASKGFKIIITIISIFILGFVYWKTETISKDVIISSCVSAPLIWDWVLKPIFKKFKLDYKINNYEKEEKKENQS